MNILLKSTQNIPFTSLNRNCIDFMWINFFLFKVALFIYVHQYSFFLFNFLCLDHGLPWSRKLVTSLKIVLDSRKTSSTRGFLGRPLILLGFKFPYLTLCYIFINKFPKIFKILEVCFNSIKIEKK